MTVEAHGRRSHLRVIAINGENALGELRSPMAGDAVLFLFWDALLTTATNYLHWGISIRTDVYDFKHMPSLATLVDKIRANAVPELGPEVPDLVICTVAGDFLSR